MRRRGRPGLIGTAARTAVIAGTAQATAGAVNRRQQNKWASKEEQQRYEAQQAAAAQQPVQAAPAPLPQASTGDDIVATLERLAKLHAAGVLTDAEFTAAKAAALG